MSWKRFFLVSSIIVVIGCILLGSLVFIWGMRFWGENSLAYIERTSGVLFPHQVSQVDVFDNHEFYVVAHVRLQEEDTPLFLNQYGFGTTPNTVTPWIESLKPENRTIPADASLRYLAGRSQSNQWVYVLDQNSGRLWVVVFYPDPGGATP